MTREEALEKFRRAKAHKRKNGMKLVEILSEEYRKETGLEPTSYEIW